MYTVNVNGRDYTCAEDKKLLRFLRDELHLMGAKDGCSEGICGSCTVLADGRKTRSCLIPLSRLQGKRIVTVEGIEPAEMAIYEHCFAAVGAVQCGFCTPGLVMCAKALLDSNLEPTLAQVKQAIQGNICRCTGYQRIEEAILLAADFRREGRAIPPAPHRLRLNQDAKRLDAAEKIRGIGLYADDIVRENMLFAQPIYVNRPRARIDRVNVARAAAHPACVRVLTKRDVPHNKIGHIKQDWDVMMGEGDITRYVGNVVAVVASRDSAALPEICALVEVDYSDLEPLTSAREALKPGAPLVHEGGNLMSQATLVRGDAEAAIAASKYVVTRKYTTSWQEHAFLEPECCVAEPEGEDGLLLYSSTQSVYDVRRDCALMLQIPQEKVHCRATLVGGAFGGKEDMSVQPYAALMAYATKLPVKVKYSRQESLDYHVKRHPMELEFTTACDAEGHLTAMKGVIVADTGAYASLGGPVLERACTHASGPYNYQNLDIRGYSVYTNNVVSGAFRGFGVAQSCFATEMNINLLAEMAGLDPWEFRYRNVIRSGEVLSNGQLAEPNTNMLACLEAVKDIYYANPYAGIACGFKNSGTGMGKRDIGRVLLSVENGRVHMRTSAACLGQGVGQMVLTEVCQATDLDPALFVYERPDTVRTPDSGTSTASRQTVMTGEAARRAGDKLKAAIAEAGSLAALEGREFLGEFSAITDPLGAIKANPISHVAYSYGAQVVVLGADGRVERAVSAFDVGVPVNLSSVAGQIEGGMVMGLGYALSEEYRCVDGRPLSKFANLGLFRAGDTPQLEVKLCVPKPGEESPYAAGAKGCGELCMIPTAPACAHAYYRWDGEFRQQLPLENTPYRPKH